MIGGPYNVDITKPYKPVFICYLDLMFSITFFTFSTLYYWTQINTSDKIDNWSSFIPSRILWFNLILGLKFFADIGYLRANSTKEELNRSKSVGRFFWFRLIFDFMSFGAIIFYYHLQLNIQSSN